MAETLLPIDFLLHGSLADNTDILFVHDHYEEDSTRHYVNNRYCKRDPSVAVGCTPGGPQVHELTHPMATYVENLSNLKLAY